MTLAFNPRGRLIVVPVYLHGPSGSRLVRLALDTGTTYTVISPDVLINAGYDLAKFTRWLRIATAGGLMDAPVVQVRSLEALGQAQLNFGVLCHSVPVEATVDGLLGLDFLRGRRLTIDFRAGALTLD
jgi:predicted aspartyl protease